MKAWTLWTSLLLWSSAMAPAVAQPSPVSASEFAYGIRMTPKETLAVHTALLPDAVYRGSVGRDLADIRVFNADGQPLTHAVRSLPRPPAAPSVTHPLPWFVLPEDPGTPSGQPSATSLRIERDEKGAVIDLQVASSGTPEPDAGGPLPTTYLVDLRGISAPVSGLRVQLAGGGGDYTAPVSVDVSEDLTEYRRNVSRQTLVSLRYGDKHVHREDVALPQPGASFVRLRFAHPPPTALAAVAAVITPPAASAARHVVRLAGTADPEAPGRYRFDAGGDLPVDRVRVRLPEDNTVVAGALYRVGASGAPTGTQQPVLRDTFYRVVQGGERFDNDSVSISRRRGRHWVLELDAAGAGLGQAMPVLELTRVPDQLLFVGRGAAPYLLAYGHHGADPSAFEARSLLEVLPTSQREGLADTSVELGTQEPLAGPTALVAPPAYRHYALWAVLVLGVLALLAVAVRLARNTD